MVNKLSSLSLNSMSLTVLLLTLCSMFSSTMHFYRVHVDAYNILFCLCCVFDGSVVSNCVLCALKWTLDLHECFIRIFEV